jgi:hypothetical protein
VQITTDIDGHDGDIADGAREKVLLTVSSASFGSRWRVVSPKSQSRIS